jgi:hypothetical protein
MFLFILLPFVGLSLGMKFQSKLQVDPQEGANYLNISKAPQPSTSIPSTMINPTIINRRVYVEFDTSEIDTKILEEKTKSWKIYQSNTFSFKYPSDWEVVDLLRINSSLPFLKNTEVYIGVRPVTLREDTLGNINVTTNSFEDIAGSNIPAAIKQHKGKYYVFDWDFDDDILKTIYASIKFVD